jgi:A/G-specific adenine glycosylase
MGKFLINLKSLETWFESQKRILPWRDRPTVYRVWVSEIMLQQTQVITVVPYFEKFMKRFPQVEHLAEAPVEEVMNYWAGLGYYSRARNLHLGAKQIVLMGRFPKSREEWLKIPGVGDYTAGAILSIASDLPEAILDGNVERVISRVRRVSRSKGDTVYKERLWKISRIWVETAYRIGIRPSNVNQALMELGATICTPKNPKCLICPVQGLCRAYEFGEQEFYPPKKKPKEWLHIKEKLHCVVNNEGQVLLRLRAPGEWRAGLWDLPENEPKNLNLKSELIGEVETQHVVTRHKIVRLTQVWKLGRSGKGSHLLKACEPSENLSMKWVSVQNPEVAIGSALKRTLKRIADTFPDL